jgi:hypothetical protein
MSTLSAVTLGCALVLCMSTLAHAQATRTWVSGVGDDANPCSRTAPCKTFAGAISKTAAKGEINVLDPGGFGGVGFFLQCPRQWQPRQCPLRAEWIRDARRRP